MNKDIEEIKALERDIANYKPESYKFKYVYRFSHCKIGAWRYHKCIVVLSPVADVESEHTVQLVITVSNVISLSPTITYEVSVEAIHDGRVYKYTPGIPLKSRGLVLEFIKLRMDFDIAKDMAGRY